VDRVEVLCAAAKEPSLTKADLYVLAAAYARHERPDLSLRFMTRLLEADPSDAEACKTLAQLYNEPIWNRKSRFEDAITTFERCATLSPKDPVGYWRAANLLMNKAIGGEPLTDQQKLGYVERGLGNVDRALGIDQDFWEAALLKVVLLRMKAKVVSDPALRQRLLDEATALQKRALALKKAGVPAPLNFPPPPPPLPPAPPPPPAFPLAVPPSPVVRVGGQVKEPKKLRNVAPSYPDIAKQARVQGVVILECTIGPDGKVTNVTVLRGIPLLNPSAIEAVKQWVYTPTLHNGVPVSVIMSVIVNFKLPPPPVNGGTP
jgi:TonB family protein